MKMGKLHVHIGQIVLVVVVTGIVIAVFVIS